MAINEQIDMGIPANSSASYQTKGREGPSFLSTDVKIWLFSGAVVGAMIQLASLGVAFIIVGCSPILFVSMIILTSFVAVILGLYLLQLVNTIFQYEILRDCHGEVEYISAEKMSAYNNTASKLKSAFLYGIVVSDNNVEKN